jgi:hypothetical protein
MLSNIWELGTAFYDKLLLSPNEILAQSRVQISKTAMGFPLEFRVDFIDGEPLSTRARFTNEYLPKENFEASETLRRFFEKAPMELRYMSGGADVAKLADGRWVIIEFNFGATSGTMSPEYFPIDANLLYSRILGHPTFYIQKLNSLHSKGLRAEVDYLRTLKHVRPLFWKYEGLRDVSVAEAGKYFRDLYLEEWSQNPTSDRAADTLQQIHQLFDFWKDQENVKDLIRGAENFVQANLIPN